MGRVVFVATDELHGRELWVTDGTQAGTQLLKDFSPDFTFSGPYSSEIHQFVNVGGKAVFFVQPDTPDGWTEQQFYVTDGTPAGTLKLGEFSFLYQFLLATDTHAFFTALTVETDTEPQRVALFVSDGTVGGTKALAIPAPVGKSLDLANMQMVETGGHTFLAALDGSHQAAHLYEFAAGALVATGVSFNIQTLSAGQVLYPVEGGFVFRNFTPGSGTELWFSDGTPAGTGLVKDIRPGPLSGIPFPSPNWLAVDGKVLFVADDGTTGPELWITDGTSAGTRLLHELFPGPQGAEWTLTRTANTTIGSLSPIATEDHVLIFAEGVGITFLVFDRKTETARVVEFRDADGKYVSPHTLSFEALDGKFHTAAILTESKNGLIASALSSAIYAIDPVTGIATVVKDIREGPGPAGLESLASPTAYAGRIVFSTLDADVFVGGFNMRKGVEPWITDGTEAGTRMIRDIMEAVGENSDPRLFTVVGDPRTSGLNDLVKLSTLAGETRLNGMTGFDTLDLSGVGSGVTVNLLEGWATGGGAAAPVQVVSFEKVVGTAQVDTLVGRDSGDTLDGGGGGDFLLGGKGNDTYIVRHGGDIVDEGFLFPDLAGLPEDFDTIISHADFWWDFYHVGEKHVIAPENPHELSAMIGSLFGSEMVGNSKDNIIYTVGGDNVVRPGDGIDWIALGTVDGFRGMDTLVLEKPSGALPSWAVVYGFMPGEDRVDVSGLDVDGFAAIQAAGHDDGAGNSYYLLDGGANILFLVGLEKADLSAADFIV